MDDSAKKIFEKMSQQNCKQVTFYYDSTTGMKAILAVDSLPTPNSSASGGTRLAHDNPDDALDDALRLAKAMTRKCRVLESSEGGAKAVVIKDQSKSEEFLESIGEFIETQHGLFKTAVDMNMDLTDADVIASKTGYIDSLGANLGSTGENTAEGMFRSLLNNGPALIGKPLQESSVAIQGLGAVGSGFLQRILNHDVQDVFVSDYDQGVLDNFKDDLRVTIVSPEEILYQSVDYLVPCAIGGVINAETVKQLRCRVVAPGANNPLDQENVIDRILARSNIQYIPDFVLNVGGYLQALCERKGMSLQEARDATDIVSRAVEKLINISGENGRTLLENAIEIYGS